MRTAPAVAVAILSCASAIPVYAQAPVAPRDVVIEVNGGFLATSRTFTDSASPMINAEVGQITADYRVPRSPSFSVGAHAPVWRRIRAGVIYAQSSRSTSANITASLPHPFFFSRSRQIEGTQPDADRTESTLALLLRREVPVARRRVTLAVFGGPAWLSIRQGVVERINYSETYPYDSATYTSAVVRFAKNTQLTFLVGSDVTYFASRRIGVGAGFRYAAATTELPASLDGDVLAIKGGGLDVATGIRFRF